MARKAAAKVGRPKGSGKKHHVPVLVQLRPDQREALRSMAMTRAKVGGRLDVSVILRELIDEALETSK